jgi:septum formation protein
VTALPLVLASQSPRRRALLAGLGLTFTVSPAHIDEIPQADETPEQLVTRLCQAKALAVSEQHPDSLILAADTTVALADTFLEKPQDKHEKRTFIKMLSGRSHTVFTGHAVMWQGQLEQRTIATSVQFRDLSPREIDWYVATEEGLDKAGGYAIQGYGAALVAEIHGCYFNVVGMSLAAVLDMCQQLGAPLV